MSTRQPPVDGACRDALFGGGLRIWQPARGHGYRFNLDPVLLAGFVRPTSRVLDLGAGCGVLGLSLLFLGRAQQLTAVEVQGALASLAQNNAEENGFRARVAVVRGDVRDLTLDRPVATVVCNPPYFRLADGRPSPDPGRRIARHEVRGSLADFVECGFRNLEPDGASYFVIRAARMEELRQLLATNRATVVRRRVVVPRRTGRANTVLVEARRRAVSGVRPSRERCEPPLIVHQDRGRDFSAEVAELLSGRG